MNREEAYSMYEYAMSYVYSDIDIAISILEEIQERLDKTVEDDDELQALSGLLTSALIKLDNIN